MAFEAQQIAVLREATLADGTVHDVRLEGGVVAEVAPAGSLAAVPGATLDLTGFLLLPAPAEPHAHLDKALSFDAIRPPAGDLLRAIESWQAYTLTVTEDDVYTRARAAALALLANGTTAVRSHVDVFGATSGDPLRGVRALVRLREDLRPVMDLELVALAGPPVPDAHVEAALDAGLDLVGGAPHLADDPVADLLRLVAIARRRGVGTDLHTDESLDGPLTLDVYARAVRDRAPGVVASAGHCCRLGTLEPQRLAEVVAEVVASDVGIITLPITNLYLQGWEHPVATPRGLTALRALLDAGARVGAGADNVRDPFNPVGRSDALETASLLVTAGHLSLDEAFAAVSSGARGVLGLPAAGPVPGAQADLLAVRAGSLGEAIANGPGDRFVLHRGRLVARSRVESQIACPPTSSQPAPLMEVTS